jgi:hypothetical protein
VRRLLISIFAVAGIVTLSACPPPPPTPPDPTTSTSATPSTSSASTSSASTNPSTSLVWDVEVPGPAYLVSRSSAEVLADLEYALMHGATARLPTPSGAVLTVSFDDCQKDVSELAETALSSGVQFVAADGDDCFAVGPPQVAPTSEPVEITQDQELPRPDGGTRSIHRVLVVDREP